MNEEYTQSFKERVLLEFANRNWNMRLLIERFDLWDELEADFNTLSENEKAYIEQHA